MCQTLIRCFRYVKNILGHNKFGTQNLLKWSDDFR